MLTITDPRTIPQSEMPLIVNCNQATITGSAIDFRTDIKGVEPFSHSMLCINQGKFVCQDPGGYKEIPMETYMVPGTILVFTELVNADTEFVVAFRQSVLAKLNGPWYRKLYNWTQILGQGLGLPWLSFPGLDDCVQDVVFHLKAAAKALPQADYEVVQGIPNNCNPEQFYDIQIQNPNVFNVKYAYSSLTGVID